MSLQRVFNLLFLLAPLSHLSASTWVCEDSPYASLERMINWNELIAIAAPIEEAFQGDRVKYKIIEKWKGPEVTTFSIQGYQKKGQRLIFASRSPDGLTWMEDGKPCLDYGAEWPAGDSTIVVLNRTLGDPVKPSASVSWFMYAVLIGVAIAGSTGIGVYTCFARNA